jgi:hypothetical protein
MNQNVLPEEKITALATETVDPFARRGVAPQNLNPHKPKPKRDFSKYDEPDLKKPAKEAPEAPKGKTEKPKRGRPSKKLLENIAEPIPEAETLVFESHSSEGLPSYRCEFAGRDIFVGLLAYKSVNPVTSMALTAMALDFGRDRIRFDMEFGNSWVSEARNNLANKFLETDAKYLFFIDDDIIPCIGRPSWMQSWVPAARNVHEKPLQRHILSRLPNANRSVVGAAYFERRESDIPKIVCSDQKLVPRAKTYEDAVVQVDWAGTGAMLIHRSVFEDIDKANPELQKRFFHNINSVTGEDISFCQRAVAVGHSIYLDIGVPTFHLGFKTY